MNLASLISHKETRKDTKKKVKKMKPFYNRFRYYHVNQEVIEMTKFLLWVLLLFLCWPLALLAIILYPIVWLLLLPFRLIGIAVDGVFELIKAVITLPARILGGGKKT